MDVRSIIRVRQERGLKLFRIPELAWKQSQQDRLGALSMGIPSFRMDPLPTDLQSPVEYYLLSNLLKEAVRTARRLGKWDGPEPVIASETAGEMNGFCFTVDSNQSAIVLDSSVVSFYALLANTAVMLMVTELSDSFEIDFGTDKLQEKVTSDQAIPRYFEQLFLSCLERGIPSVADKNFLKAAYVGFANELKKGMGLFIVGHELGHIFHKHTADHWMQNSEEEFLKQVMADGRPVYVYRAKKEIEADIYGMQIVINSIDFSQQVEHWRMFGPVLFMIGLEMLERFLFFGLLGRNRWDEHQDVWGHLVGSAELPSTHPPLLLRLNVLKDSVQKSGIPVFIKESIKQFSNNMFAVMLMLEKSAQGEVTSLRRPLRVHQKWTSRSHEFGRMGEIGKRFIDGLEKAHNERAKGKSAS
jgi:hypothetical protein